MEKAALARPFFARSFSNLAQSPLSARTQPAKMAIHKEPEMMSIRTLAPMLSVIALATSVAHAETKTYQVQGMHCGGCVKSVKAKVCQLPGVETCKVEVNKVTLTGTLNDEAIKAAVNSTGEYTVTNVLAEPVMSEKPATSSKSTKKPGS